MTIIYRCKIELHDSLYYATREIGRLYETEAILHNYALCYALGLVNSDSYRYFCREQVPQYEEHLTPLNKQGIYLTPARATSYAAVLNTWKYANNNYHVEMEKTQKNIPSFGRAKEIAPESEFEFFLLTEKNLKLPHWIRLGKWLSKAEVTVTELNKPQLKEGLFTVSYPLNPLDVMFTHQVISYDVVNMPPVSLILNTKIQGEYYQVDGVQLPARMKYRFS